MTVSLPALPALLAGRALRDEAAAAAGKVMDQVRTLLACYDLTLALIDDMPEAARLAATQALTRRLAAIDRAARHCLDRLDEAAGLCRSLDGLGSPLATVEVPDPLFEMLSPYLDDAMAPALAAIARRAGPGCSAEEVAALFAPARFAQPA